MGKLKTAMDMDALYESIVRQIAGNAINAPGEEPERGCGAAPVAGEARKVDCPVESEDEEGKATRTADGVKARGYKIGKCAH